MINLNKTLMKQFLTLCMATVMIGSAAGASAKVSFREALQLKSEGKAVLAHDRTRRNGVMPLHNRPLSAFNKLQTDKNVRTMKSRQRLMANGDAIFGNLIWTEDATALPGYYEFDGAAATLKWSNDDVNGGQFSYDADAECLKGYNVSSAWGMLFGVDYFECDPLTGDIITLESQDLSANYSYFEVSVLADDGCFYGYGLCDGKHGFIKTSADDPFSYELIADMDYFTGICYNPQKGFFVAVGETGNLMEIGKDGSIRVVGSVLTDIPDFYPYLGGMVYNPGSNLYYWNAQLKNGSAMYTINPDNYAMTNLGYFPTSEEYLSLVTTDVNSIPGQPAAPEAGAVSFNKAELMGTVSFTLPSKYKDGTPIESRVRYIAYLNGDVYTSGSQKAGAEIAVPYIVPTDGLYTFGLVAEVDGVSSKMVSLHSYVGNDQPLNPTNVVLSAESLTWDAVPTGYEGVHGGWVQPGKVTYTVLVNGIEKTSGLTECSCNPGIDTDALIEAYTATVIAVCNGQTSANGVSNSIVTGSPYTLPATFEPTPDQFDVSTVYDGNGRKGFTLEKDASGYYVQCGYTTTADITMDAWYFLPPVTIDDADKYYSFEVEAALCSPDYTDEAFEVLVCNEPTPAGVVGVVMDETIPESTDFSLAYTTFSVRQPGTYYLAFHCISAGDQFGIRARNFSISDNNITDLSPARASYVTAAELTKGDLVAAVGFKFPTTDLAGNPLAEGTELNATISTSIDDVTISGKAGETVSGLKMMTLQGMNTITVVVSDPETGFNSPKATTEVYTGVTVPALPKQLRGKSSEDNMSIILSWDPVTTPEDPDGIIDPAKVQYVIYEYIESVFGSEWSPIAYTSDTTYVYSVAEGSPQSYMPIGVGSMNAAGANDQLIYFQGNIGTPYALPMTEVFNPDGFKTQPWIIGTFDNVAQPEWNVRYMKDLYEGEDGGFLAAMGKAGAAGYLMMPRFSSFGETVRVTFDICAEFDLPKISIIGETFDSGECNLGTLSVEKGTGFRKAYIDLPAELLNKNWVQLYIIVEFTTADEILAISNISVDNTSGVRSILSGNDIRISAEKGRINVSGLDGHDVVVSTLDGKVAAKKPNAKGNASFILDKGIYVVNAADRNAKVMVK